MVIFRMEQTKKQICDKCKATFTTKSHLTRHVPGCGNHLKPYQCSKGCIKYYSRPDNRAVHEKNCKRVRLFTTNIFHF